MTELRRLYPEDVEMKLAQKKTEEGRGGKRGGGRLS
jgi:hypothetical protein